MTIDNLPLVGLNSNFPAIGNKIIQEFRQDAMSYIQSDHYQGLEFYGKYTFQKMAMKLIYK